MVLTFDNVSPQNHLENGVPILKCSSRVVIRSSSERIKNQKCFVADIVRAYSLPSEAAQLCHGFKDKSKNTGEVKVSCIHRKVVLTHPIRFSFTFF